LPDDKEAVDEIVARIAGITRAERGTAFGPAHNLGGIETFGANGGAEDKEERSPIGSSEGPQKGLQQGELTILRRQIEKRFGTLPKWVGDKLAALSASELEDLSERVLDANNVEELLR
jgi:hypothetical protein